MLSSLTNSSTRFHCKTCRVNPSCCGFSILPFNSDKNATTFPYQSFISIILVTQLLTQNSLTNENQNSFLSLLEQQPRQQQREAAQCLEKLRQKLLHLLQQLASFQQHTCDRTFQSQSQCLLCISSELSLPLSNWSRFSTFMKSSSSGHHSTPLSNPAVLAMIEDDAANEEYSDNDSWAEDDDDIDELMNFIAPDYEEVIQTKEQKNQRNKTKRHQKDNATQKKRAREK